MLLVILSIIEHGRGVRDAAPRRSPVRSRSVRHFRELFSDLSPTILTYKVDPDPWRRD
jgi:hypothetical protein